MGACKRRRQSECRQPKATVAPLRRTRLFTVGQRQQVARQEKLTDRRLDQNAEQLSVSQCRMHRLGFSFIGAGGLHNLKDVLKAPASLIDQRRHGVRHDDSSQPSERVTT